MYHKCNSFISRLLMRNSVRQLLVLQMLKLVQILNSFSRQKILGIKVLIIYFKKSPIFHFDKSINVGPNQTNYDPQIKYNMEIAWKASRGSSIAKHYCFHIPNACRVSPSDRRTTWKLSCICFWLNFIKDWANHRIQWMSKYIGIDP